MGYKQPRMEVFCIKFNSQKKWYMWGNSKYIFWVHRYCGVACQKRDWKAHRKICKQPEEAASDPTNQSKEPKDNGVKGADDAAADLTKNMEDLSVTKKSKVGT